MGGELRPPCPADGVRGETALPAGPLGSLVSQATGSLCGSSKEREEGEREVGERGRGQGEEEGQGKGEGRKGDRDRDRKTRARGDRRVQRISIIEEEARVRKTGEERHGQNGKSVQERGRDTETKTENRQVKPRENTGASRTYVFVL